MAERKAWISWSAFPGSGVIVELARMRLPRHGRKGERVVIGIHGLVLTQARRVFWLSDICIYAEEKFIVIWRLAVRDDETEV